MPRHTTQTSLMMAMSFAIVCLFIASTTNAHSLRKRYSSPHVQLSRQRRRLERLYNQLLVVYQLMNLEENVEEMKPVMISASWPENVEMQKVMRALYSGEGQAADSSLMNRNAASRSRSSLPQDVTSVFTRRLMQNKLSTQTNKMPKNTRRRNRIFSTSIRLSDNSLTSHGRSNNVNNDTAALRQKVKQLCHVVNKRIKKVSSGVIVRSCKLH